MRKHKICESLNAEIYAGDVGSVLFYAEKDQELGKKFWAAML